MSEEHGPLDESRADGVPSATLEELSPSECIELASTVAVGRVGFVSEHDVIDILPVNHIVHEGTVAFRTTDGTKLDVARRRPGSEYVFEVDQYDEETGAGWSVLIRGPVESVLDEVQKAALNRTGHLAWPDATHRVDWVRIHPESITGSRVSRGD
jgi:nitroimidazol reductase NimA-like FMN-containing flavoprotein (pyridoxamine 5'-phosphate oxidase superfamily)